MNYARSTTIHVEGLKRKMVNTEKQLLYYFLLDNSLIISDIEHLFSLELHREIYQKMIQLKNFSPAELADNLEIVNPYPAITDLLNYGLPVKELYFKRTIKALQESHILRKIETSMKSNMPFPINEIRVLLDSVEYTEIETSGLDLNELIELKGDKMKSYDIGISSADIWIGGFIHADVLTVMARPGVGKTWLILNLLLNWWWTTEAKIAFFSLEMQKPIILERLIQLRFMKGRGEVTKEYIENNRMIIDPFVKGLESVDFYTSSYSIEDIRLKVRKGKYDILFIDFLDLIVTSEHKSPYERVSNIILQIKQIAKKENVFIIIAHQLSRLASDGSIPVRLHHGRDSGKIEENSDFMIGLYRPEISDTSDESKHKICLSLIKNKRGPIGTVPCHYDPNYWKIMEIEK